MGIFAGNSLWHMVMQSDAMTKMVLLLLLGMSVACWAIFLCKMVLLRMKKKQMKVVMVKLQGARSVDDVYTVASAHQQTLPGYFLSKNVQYLKLLAHSEQAGRSERSDHRWELMHHYMEQQLDTLVGREESFIALLSISAGVAPLLGLFGTVWGLVHAFVRISELQSADIAAVAPGIAEALITTLAGLMVAIPAYTMYHYLMIQVRAVETRLMKMADKISFVAQQLLG